MKDSLFLAAARAASALLLAGAAAGGASAAPPAAVPPPPSLSDTAPGRAPSTEPARTATPATTPAAAPAKARAPAAAPLVAPAPEGEPRVERSVIEDEGSRIEELRVRGQTRSISVTPKVGTKRGYEILLGDGSNDTSDGATSARGATGKRVWRVLSF